LLAAVNRYQNVAASKEQMFKTIKLDPYYYVVFVDRIWKGLSRRYFQMRKENRVVLDTDDEKQVGNEPQAGID
jgi:hypothetical protein